MKLQQNVSMRVQLFKGTTARCLDRRAHRYPGLRREGSRKGSVVTGKVARTRECLQPMKNSKELLPEVAITGLLPQTVQDVIDIKDYLVPVEELSRRDPTGARGLMV